MGAMTTKELFDEFFASPEGKKYSFNRKATKEDQLYAFEMETGKELVDMTVDDFIKFLSNANFRRFELDSNIIPNRASLDFLISLYKKIINFYIDYCAENNYPIIRNIFYDKRLSIGANLLIELSEGKERFSWTMVEDIIKKLHKDRTPDRADYIELIILLYYSGFESAAEITELKESDINHNSKTVYLQGRTVYLSDRCYFLLTKFNGKYEFDESVKFVFSSWENSYFKFLVSRARESDIDKRTSAHMCQYINAQLSKYVNAQYGTQINGSNLYKLGFYDYLVKKYGEKEVNAILISNYDKERVQKLQQSAVEYGFKFSSISQLKRHMRMFIIAENK